MKKRIREPYTGDSYTSAWRRAKRLRQEAEAVTTSREHQVPAESLQDEETVPTEDRHLPSPVEDIHCTEIHQVVVSAESCNVTLMTTDNASVGNETACSSEGDTLRVFDAFTPQKADATNKTCNVDDSSPQSSQINSIGLHAAIPDLSSSVSSMEDNLAGVADDDVEVTQPGHTFESSYPHSIHLSSDGGSSDISAVSDPDASSDDSDTDSVMCDPHCFEAHYLEEAPLFPDLEEEEEDDPNPDEPGNSDEDSDDGPSTDDDSDNDSDGDLATFASEELNAPAALANVLTKGQLILIQLATASRHNKTFECLLDDFRNMNVLLGKNWLPESKSKLFACINLKKKAAKFHAYCGKKECGVYIGRKDRLPENIRCPKCHHTTPKSKAPFFVMLNFRRQLQTFLRTPGIWEKLQYRQNRVKSSPTAIEDVYDCSKYIEMRSPGGALASDFSFSYVVNSDAFKPFKKSGKLKVWVILARVNELPPDMRQKCAFLVGLYVDRHDPNFQAFLKPFVEEANHLSSVGISWKPDSVHEQVSRFVCFCHSVDSPARCAILQMNTVTGYFGCTYCLQEGVRLAGSNRYSFLDEEGNYVETEDRTHDGMVADMLASRHGVDVHGHKGLSQLLLLENFDLREGQAHDDLHQDHEGCAKDLTELLLTEARARVGGVDVPAIDILREIDRRMLPIETPSIIARKPSSITKRGTYKGSAWRNWLLYYGVPCLSGLIQPPYLRLMANLSHACYRLSQDVLEEADFHQAGRNLKSLGQGFQERFGLEKVKHNLHATVQHKVKSVRTLGPPWNTSTYNFESLNCKLGPLITSPKGIMEQVVTRCFLELTVNLAVHDETLPNRVRKRLQEITSKRKLKRVSQVGPHTYAVGTRKTRAPTAQERAVMNREDVDVQEVHEYPSVLKRRVRIKSIHHQGDSKSNDSFFYTSEDTFCTIERVLVFSDANGEQHCGLIVNEHEVARHLEVASHIAVLQANDADLLHFIDVQKIRCPAIKYDIDGIVYAVPIPNCQEID